MAKKNLVRIRLRITNIFMRLRTKSLNDRMNQGNVRKLVGTTRKKIEKRLEGWLKIVCVKRVKDGRQDGEWGHFKYGGPGI